jgi:hypothetical protein
VTNGNASLKRLCLHTGRNARVQTILAKHFITGSHYNTSILYSLTASANSAATHITDCVDFSVYLAIESPKEHITEDSYIGKVLYNIQVLI